jgi:translation initiation factor 2-alpha kinase 4
VHRGITARCVGLASNDNPNQPKSIKLCKATFHTRLLDLHRSNSFGPLTPVPVEESLGGGWVSRDVQNESSLLYTRQRDIHDVGIVLAQMLMGLDVVTRVQDPQTAIQACTSVSLFLMLFD